MGWGRDPAAAKGDANVDRGLIGCRRVLAPGPSASHLPGTVCPLPGGKANLPAPLGLLNRGDVMKAPHVVHGLKQCYFLFLFIFFGLELEAHIFNFTQPDLKV